MIRVDPKYIDGLMITLRQRLKIAMEKHGDQALTNGHEIIGGLTEEFDEFKAAAHKYKHDPSRANYQECNDELMDLAVQAIFGSASLIVTRDARQKTTLG